MKATRQQGADLRQSEQKANSWGKSGIEGEEGTVLTWGSERERSAMRSHGERLSSQASPQAAAGLAKLPPA
jgi:hypothetical protein